MTQRPKVSIVKCADYQRARLYDAVKESIDLIGGIGVFVRPGQKVLIKPNILSARKPEEAVCTHPEFIRAVVRIVKTCADKISIGDSPGGFQVRDISEVYRIAGIEDIAGEEGVEAVKFSAAKNINGFPIAKAVIEADVIISLPKMKTHNLTTLTGAVKNMFGSVIGMHKAECHFKYKRISQMSGALVDVFSFNRPALSIMDGILAMDKDGPASGRPRNAGIILAGADAVAVDAVFAGLTGMPPNDCPTTKIAAERALGVSDLGAIDILGEKLQDARPADFILPRASYVYKAPAFLIDLLGKGLRAYPFIDAAACKRCKVCQKTCPTGAITIEEKLCDIDYSGCIFCFCCHEVCPHKAVGTRRSFLGSVLNAAMEAKARLRRKKKG